MQDWKILYPSLKLSTESLRAEHWLKGHETQAKQKKQWRRFLTNWMQKAEDKASNQAAYRASRLGGTQPMEQKDSKEAQESITPTQKLANNWKRNAAKFEAVKKKYPHKVRHLTVFTATIEDKSKALDVNFEADCALFDEVFDKMTGLGSPVVNDLSKVMAKAVEANKV